MSVATASQGRRADKVLAPLLREVGFEAEEIKGVNQKQMQAKQAKAKKLYITDFDVREILGEGKAWPSAVRNRKMKNIHFDVD